MKSSCNLKLLSFADSVYSLFAVIFVAHSVTELQLRSYGNSWSGDEGLLYLCVCYSCVKLFACGSLLQQKVVPFLVEEMIWAMYIKKQSCTLSCYGAPIWFMSVGAA